MKIIKLLTTLSLCLPVAFSFAQNQNTANLPSNSKKNVYRIPSQTPAIPDAEVTRGEYLPNQLTDLKFKSFSPDYLIAAESEMKLMTKFPSSSVTFSENGTLNSLFLKKEIQIQTHETLEDAALKFLESNKNLFGIKNPATGFRFKSKEIHSGTTHLRFDQTYNGFIIWASDLIVHISEKGIYGINGRIQNDPIGCNTQPTILIQDAISIAAKNLQTKSTFVDFSDETKKILEYYGPKVEFVILPPKKLEEKFQLVYHLTILPNLAERWEYFVNASNGEILHSYNHICTSGPATATAKDMNGKNIVINTYEYNGSYYLLDATRPMFNASASSIPNSPAGAIVTYSAANTQLSKLNYIKSTNNSWNNPKAVTAHNNAAICYEYYKNTHGRNSIDGKGGTIVSVIDVTESDGSKMDNAFWNGTMMAYGDGQYCLNPLVKGLDVAAHEMTHGVVSNSANLEYQDQSGAINESIADIFGCMVDRDDWKMGEDVVKTTCFPSGAMRDLSNPHNGGTSQSDSWQPKKMSEFVQTENDNGGVHINSGIPNHAFYLYATAITKEKAEKIFYRALISYLTRSSQFIDLRRAVVRAAKDLYGDNSNEVNQAKDAFDKVEIFDGTKQDYTHDLPPVVGNPYLLVHGLKDATNGIFLYNLNTKKIVTIQKDHANRRATCLDDGGYIYYVKAKDKNIYTTTVSETNPEDFQMTTDGIWENAAISRDGRKLACVTSRADSSIWVYSFDLRKWRRFILYHPSYTQGVSGGNPKYTDVFEWDPTGEYIMYDAYTEYDDGQGGKLDYWDIGIIRTWDNNAANFGNGKVEKLFSSLPANTGVGNPSFAKNSGHIACFDYFNENENNSNIISINFESSKLATVSESSSLGYPTFSGLDDQIAYSDKNSDSNQIVNAINMKGDKISPNGLPTTLIRNCRWPLWFTRGERPVSNELTHTISNAINVYPNPVKDNLNVDFSKLNEAGIAKIQIYNSVGQIVYSFTGEIPSEKLLEINVKQLTGGIYWLKCISGNAEHSLSQKIIIQD